LDIGDIPVERVWEAQQAGLMRLQLYLVGRTHRLLNGLVERARGVLLKTGGEEGGLDGLGFYQVMQVLEREWGEVFAEWLGLFRALRWEGGALAFGTLAVLHNRYLILGIGERASRGAGGRLEEQEGGRDLEGGVFEPQLKAVLDAGEQRIYGDGLQLSERVWRLEREAREGIQQVLARGVADGDSAWNIAKELEGFLGPGEECPRWTRTRLYGLTKKEIAAGDRRGLYTGDECAGQGVAYKALRLARTEIQYVHHLASDMLMARMPWVEQEQVWLSPSHPVEDICDDVVGGGEAGDGVYPKGTIVLPLHPNCICGKSGVLMDADEFVGRLRGWMWGTEPWAEMDGYTDWLGVGGGELAGVSLAVGMAEALAVWLWGDEEALDARVGEAQLNLPGF